MDTPLVSVIVTTYQHEKYIEQCLRSILAQKTDFLFELLVGVDEGSDRTLQICRELERSELRMKVIVNDSKNVTLVNGNRIGRSNFLNVLKSAKGKYVARCDGDDYWTLPEKLQKQVEFLESNPTVSLVFTNRTILEGEKEVPNDISLPHGKYTRKNVVNGIVAFMQTSMYKRDLGLIDFMIANNDIQGGDYLISYFYSLKGDIFYLSDLKTAVYRKNSGGIWTSQVGLDKRVTIIKQMLILKERLKIESSKHIYKRIGKDLVFYFKQDRANLSAYSKRIELKGKMLVFAYFYGFLHYLKQLSGSVRNSI